jgi:hypothetical protein
MLNLLYIAAISILAFALWLICWWDTAEPALNGWASRRAEAREYRRTHRAPSGGSYWIIPACAVIAIWAIWSILH